MALWLLIPGAGRLPAFEPLWVARYRGNSGVRGALATDRLGNTYVTGCEATVKYDRDGRQVWAVANQPALSYSSDCAIGLDNTGNVYISGTIVHEGRDNYGVIKYRPTGEQAWVARYDHGHHYGGEAMAGFVDSAGNVYLTGYSYDDSTWYDCATVKFDSSGARQWVARWDAGECRDDMGRAITADPQGNVYVAGIACAGPGYYLTLKYSPAGDLLWDRVRVGGAYAKSVAVDRAGNVYSFGNGADSVGGYAGYALLKYDSAGQELWARYYIGPGGQDAGYSMVLDSLANAYATGLSDGLGTRWDICTIKWDSAGNRLWVARYDRSTWGDYGVDLATDGKYVYTVGLCTDDSSPTGGSMCFVTCDADSGAILWAAPLRDPGATSASASAVAIGPDGCAHATGWCYDSTTQVATYLTLKYTCTGTGVSLEPSVTARLQLQVVPNPLSDRATVRYQAPMPGWARITSVDVAGRTVATLFNGTAAGNEEVTWRPAGLAAGVYFIRLETATARISRRVILTQDN